MPEDLVILLDTLKNVDRIYIVVAHDRYTAMAARTNAMNHDM